MRFWMYDQMTKLLNLMRLRVMDYLAYSKKKQVRYDRYSFEKTPVISRFVSLTLELPDKTKPDPWKSHKIVLNPSCKFHMIFS